MFQRDFGKLVSRILIGISLIGFYEANRISFISVDTSAFRKPVHQLPKNRKFHCLSALALRLRKSGEL